METRIIKNLITFQEIKVQDIMNPRTVVVMASADPSLKEVYKGKLLLRFSRNPVFAGERDNVLGYIHKHELLEKLADDQHQKQVKEIVRN